MANLSCHLITFLLLAVLCVQAKYLRYEPIKDRLARDLDSVVTQNAQGHSVTTFNGRVYTIVLDADKSWNDAEHECEGSDESSTLATAETPEELAFLRDFIRVATAGRKIQRYWIGGRKMPKETEYQWIANAEPVSTNFWMAGHPSYGGKAARCSELFYEPDVNSPSGRDQLCSAKLPAYICKSDEVTTNPPEESTTESTLPSDETTTMTVDTTTVLPEKTTATTEWTTTMTVDTTKVLPEKTTATTEWTTTMTVDTTKVLPEKTTATTEWTTTMTVDTTTVLPEKTTATIEWTTTTEEATSTEPWTMSPKPATTTTTEQLTSTFSSEDPSPVTEVTTQYPAPSTTPEGMPSTTINCNECSPLHTGLLHIQIDIVQEI